MINNLLDVLGKYIINPSEAVDASVEIHEQLNKEYANEKKLIQLRTKLEFYKKLQSKVEKIMNAELELEDYSEEVYNKISKLENELESHKMEMDLPDEAWDEDES